MPSERKMNHFFFQFFLVLSEVSSATVFSITTFQNLIFFSITTFQNLFLFPREYHLSGMSHPTVAQVCLSNCPQYPFAMEFFFLFLAVVEVSYVMTSETVASFRINTSRLETF